jgi:hypothetical protein
MPLITAQFAKTPIALIALATFTFLSFASSAQESKTLFFSGYEWTVRSNPGGPGPNEWKEENVWVDGNGWLHLKISVQDNMWSCAELYTTRRFGFGKYQFEVIGRIDQLDDNVVLGLFNYPTEDVGPDTTNEMDIEFSRWGDGANPMGNYTVWPTKLGLQPAERTFSFSLNSDTTTHVFHRGERGVLFQSLYGFQSHPASRMARWLYLPKTPGSRISRKPMPVHINLWLFDGLPPKDQQEIEIIIASFRFTPS